MLILYTIPIFFIVVLIIMIAVIVHAISPRSDTNVAEKATYDYVRKNSFMTQAEHQCFDALVEAIGQDYRIFAQVHLPTLVDHTIRGQDWRAALAHINRKSVDFVLCDKVYLAPKLAIELDDASHERLDRQERDREVECILREAGLPLLRIPNHNNLDPNKLKEQVIDAISLKPTA